MLPVRILGDRVLVQLPPKETESDPATGYTTQLTTPTESGIVLAKPTDVFEVELATRGIVVQLGRKTDTISLDEALSTFSDSYLLGQIREYKLAVEEVRDELKRLGPAPFDVAVGDCVVFAPSAGEKFHYENTDYLILREADILGVLAEREAA